MFWPRLVSHISRQEEYLLDVLPSFHTSAYNYYCKNKSSTECALCVFLIYKKHSTLCWVSRLLCRLKILFQKNQWRQIRNWYVGKTCSMCMVVPHLTYIILPSGKSWVHQGSVLSPTFFNIIMDPIITVLSHWGCVYINGLYSGASRTSCHLLDLNKLFLSHNDVSFSQNNIKHLLCEIKWNALIVSGTAKNALVRK